MMDEPTTARQARARWSQPPVRGLAGWSSYGKGLLCTSPTAAAAASGAASSSRSGTSSAGGGPQYSSSLPRGSHHNTLGASSTTAPTASDAASPSTTVLPRRSPHVGMFAHAPPTRGFKDIIFEPYGFSMGRPSLTQMDLARQERFRRRHVEPAELQQLPASLYHECRREQRERRRRRDRAAAAATAAMSKSLGALDSLELEVDASSQFAWSYALVPPGMTTASAGEQGEEEEEEEEEQQPWQFPMQGVDDEEGAARLVGLCADAGNHHQEEEGEEDGGSEEDSDEDSHDGPPVCVICLDAFSASDVVRELPDCGHVHHKRCIDLWLRGVCSFEACYTRSCPTCKTPISFTPNPTTTTTTTTITTIPTTDAAPAPGNTAAAAPGLVARIFEIPRSAYARVGSLLLQGGGDGAAAATTSQGGV